MKRLNFKRSEIDELMIVINYVGFNVTLCAVFISPWSVSSSSRAFFVVAVVVCSVSLRTHHETKDEDR